MQITKQQIESALICLRNESKKKSVIFNIQFFLRKHGLTKTFNLALQNLKIYTRTDGWVTEALIDEKLVDAVWNKCLYFEETYLERERKQKRSKLRNKIGRILDKYDFDKNDIYISVNEFSKKVPREIMDKGISIGSGIFIININHFGKGTDAED